MSLTLIECADVLAEDPGGIMGEAWLPTTFSLSIGNTKVHARATAWSINLQKVHIVSCGILFCVVWTHKQTATRQTNIEKAKQS